MSWFSKLFSGSGGGGRPEEEAPDFSEPFLEYPNATHDSARAALEAVFEKQAAAAPEERAIELEIQSMAGNESYRFSTWTLYGDILLEEPNAGVHAASAGEARERLLAGATGLDLAGLSAAEKAGRFDELLRTKITVYPEDGQYGIGAYWRAEP